MLSSTYFTYFDNLENFQFLLDYLNSAKNYKINENIFIIIPSYELFNSIYSILELYNKDLTLKYFILENSISIEKIEKNSLKFYSVSYFLFNSKNNYEYFIDCKLPCLFNKFIKINELTSNNTNNTLFTIKKTLINYNSYTCKLPLIAKKILDSKLNNMDFDFLHINIYSSYFLNLFFKENKYEQNNVLIQTNKFILNIDDNNFELDNSLNIIKKNDNNFYYFYIFFLIINNQVSIYNLSNNLNLPEYFYLFNNENLSIVFNFFPFLKYHFIIF